MKKIISIILSFSLLLTISSFSFTAFANEERTAESISLNETKSFVLNNSFVTDYGSVRYDYDYYFSFIPTVSGSYEFIVKTDSPQKSNDIELTISDNSKGEFGWANYNYVAGECKLIKELEANTLYHIETSKDYDIHDLVNCTITVVQHTHDLYIDYKNTATPYADGYVEYQCSSCDYYSIADIPQITNISVDNTTFNYNGKDQSPTPFISNKEGNQLNQNVDYTVEYPNGRKNPGKHTLKIVFTGDYYGTIEKEFIINPKSTSLKSVKAGKKSLTVTWKKQSTQISGYQIQYSTDKDFRKNNKTVTVKGNKKTSSTIKKLKSNKKYYVRVRTYKTADYKNYYSSWSKAKSVKVK